MFASRFSGWGRVGARLGERRLGRRPSAKIAALTTIFYKYSHSEHIVDRFLEGYGWEGQHHRPPMDVVSLYVEQVGQNDLSRERAKRHPQMKIYPTIAEALTCGRKQAGRRRRLAHRRTRRYPRNEKGQTPLSPLRVLQASRRRLSRKSGKTAPIFNDKHLSWSWDHAQEMVDTAKTMGFGLMAGSSLPVTWRQPAIDFPFGAEVEEAVGIWTGGIDGGDIHVIEALQSIVERRRGGETGVRRSRRCAAKRSGRRSRAVRGRPAAGTRICSRPACAAAISSIRPDRRTATFFRPTTTCDGSLPNRMPIVSNTPTDSRPASSSSSRARADGGVVRDCSVAARLKGNEIFSVLFYLPYYTMRNFFSPLVHHIESLFLTGKSPYPIERTLLTTGMTAGGVESLFQKQKRLETPHLAVAYQPTTESTFWRS